MNKNNINLVVASSSFIQRLGIKTIINVVGIDCAITEVNTLADLLNLQKFMSDKPEFIIISDDLIESQQQINKVVKTYSTSKIMLSCKFIAENIDSERITSIPFSYSKAEVINEFKEFLTISKETEQVVHENSTVLSDREADVLKLIAKGLSNKEIASKLYISINTVITHRKHITDKLDIKTIAGLTVYAILNNYINPDDVNQ